MKNLKFRIFNELSNKIQDVVSLWHRPNGEIAHVVVALDEDYLEVDTLFRNYQLMQSTGIKDSNGNEIFEGDIIFQKSNPEWRSNIEEKFVIQFGYQDLGNSSYQQTIGWNATNINSYYKENSCLKKGIRDLCINHPGITAVVIGNIHENPELLNT